MDGENCGLANEQIAYFPDLALHVSYETCGSEPVEILTPCMQKVRDLVQNAAPEQCQVDYMEGDCSSANFVPWNTANSAFICVHIFGVLVMFLSLSIVCDEFFVPALEVMVERWEIDPDIAGATLMAAGGSAPELFTSFIGTFAESAVGFGTIVGSAVFNVLFVIGTCAVASKEPLHLTWWPLARDCSYHCTSLLVLALLFGKVAMKPTTDENSNAEWVKHGELCYWAADGDYAKPQDCAAIYTGSFGSVRDVLRVLPRWHSTSSFTRSSRHPASLRAKQW